MARRRRFSTIRGITRAHGSRKRHRSPRTNEWAGHEQVSCQNQWVRNERQSQRVCLDDERLDQRKGEWRAAGAVGGSIGSDSGRGIGSSEEHKEGKDSGNVGCLMLVALRAGVGGGGVLFWENVQ